MVAMVSSQIRPATPARWQQAIERAEAEHLAVYEIEPGRYMVPSAGQPHRAYEVTKTTCTCPAGAYDETCKHRAAVRARLARLGVVEAEMMMAKSSLAQIDAKLEPFNASIEFGDGSYSHYNRRDHARLLRLREIQQQRVWDAEDAWKRAMQ